MKNIIQIAGIKDLDEAKLLVECGVDFLGFPLRLKNQKDDLSESEAAAIVRSLPSPVCGVMITYLEDAGEIADLCGYIGTHFVQIHGDISPGTLSRLKKKAPELRVIKSLIVREDNLADLKTALFDFSPLVDAFILDTYDPVTGAYGATGKTHDWKTSRTLVGLSSKPVILAGGLTPKNVRRAVLDVRPAGVDAHTGVEGPGGRKNRDLVEEFVSQAKEGFAAI